MQPVMHLYITHALYFEIYTPSLEGIQLMSIAGYEVLVCVCFFVSLEGIQLMSIAGYEVSVCVCFFVSLEGIQLMSIAGYEVSVCVCFFVSLEGIQLISIAGYEVFVCVCFFVYKTLCVAFIWLPCDARSRPYVCLYCTKFIFNS